MKFRDLRANEIDVRVGQVGDGYCTLLLYKDARVDMDILDETFGVEFWQREHYECKGNLFCKVGILCPTNKSEYEQFEWVWKADCGTESNTEKEKGESSDSFKRACVNWGIGRELYTAPLIKINCATTKNDKGKFNVKSLTNFSVANIVIENKTIKGLRITAWDKGNRMENVVFEWGKLKGNDEPKIANVKGDKATDNKQVEKKFLTLAEAENLLMPIGNGQSIEMKKLSIGQLEKVMNNTNPEFAKHKEAAKLILEFKANGNQG
jgi:hypothetical protein